MASTVIKPVLRFRSPTGETSYLGVICPEQIRALTFVPVAERSVSGTPAVSLVERAGGYQRAGDPARMDRLKRFFQERPACIIPPVVLSSRGKWRFEPANGLEDVGALHISEGAAIVDGQHRLGAMWRTMLDAHSPLSLKEKPIPFMLVDDLSVNEETREFIDINDNQKGVKKSLLAWLDRDTSFAGQSAHALAGDPESPFCGRIGTQVRRSWELMLFGAVKECVESMFGEQLRHTRKFAPESDQTHREAGLEMVIRYWTCVRQAMPDHWRDIDLMPAVGVTGSAEYPGTRAFRHRLLEETGIRAFARLAQFLFSVTWIDQLQSPSWDLIDSILRELSTRKNVDLVLTKPRRNPHVLEFDPYLNSTGKAGTQAMYRHLEAEVLAILGNRAPRPGAP